jgi:putative ABC transport system permease protein
VCAQDCAAARRRNRERSMKRYWFEFSESCRIAGRQIAANRLRSFLTALGVAIGIVAVTLMGAAIRGIDTGFDQSMALLGDDVLYIEKWPWALTKDFWTYRNRPDIKASFADRLNEIIESTPNSLLQLALAVPVSVQTVTYGKRQLRKVYTLGTTNDYSYLGPTDCKEGRFLNEFESRGGRNVCVIGLDIADKLFGSEGPLGKVIRVGNQAYSVVGVFEKQGTFLGLFSWDSQAVVPLASYEKYFTMETEIGKSKVSIRVKVKDRRRLEEAKEELRGDFRRIQRLLPEQADNFSINEQQAFRSALEPVKAGLASAGLFITGLALFVGAIGIMNITFVSVRERTREIGVRRALGARHRTILIQFLVEAVSICLVGGVIGLALAFLLFALMTASFPSFPIRFSPSLVVVALVVSVLTGITSGFAPAWQASRLNPVEALRYE